MIMCQSVNDEEDPPILKMGGFDDCVIGFIERNGEHLHLLYDKELVIQKLLRSGMQSYEEALEYYEFNQVGAYLGPTTPAFLNKDFEEIGLDPSEFGPQAAAPDWENNPDFDSKDETLYQ